MASMRCSTCDINYPDNRTKCMVCKGDLWKLKDPHETDWKQKVAALQVEHDLEIPAIDVQVVQWKGHLFVTGYGLEDAGIMEPHTDMILNISGEYFEIQGAYHAGPDAVGWWVIPMEFEWDHDKYPVMSAWDYEQLEKKRGKR